MTTICLDTSLSRDTINRNIYGHFAEHLGRCIYEGFWVGEESPIPNARGIRTDVVEALKKLRIPVLRWPGGCFADDYHWRDGIGPRHQRPRSVNVHWGGVTETNHFGTHEFFDLCDLLGCEPYICGNVGSGKVQEMRDWVEYLTFGGDSSPADLRRVNGRAEPWRVPYFGVGNENWGCGGNMRPEYYADLYRRFSTYVRNYSGNRILKIACGPNNDDYRWTEVLMREAGRYMDGLSLHYYTIPGGWEHMNAATEFSEGDWFETMRRALFLDEIITRHAAIMDRFDTAKRVGLIVDEWGTWYAAEVGSTPGFVFQQNTMRDALVAGVSLNILNNHCDRVHMANIAQVVNVLQAMILTDGPKMLLTPTYHVFEMYAAHQNAVLVPLEIVTPRCGSGDDSVPQVSASASIDAGEVLHVTLCNLSPTHDAAVTMTVRGKNRRRISGQFLAESRMNAHNTFEQPDAVRPRNYEDARLENDAVVATLPPMSVVALAVE